jgi:putative ABC transport system permease protein
MLLESLLRDVTLSIRLLRNNPAYSLTALLTLALGLATTTAMFAVIDATLLRPLPFADPDRLVSLNSLMPGPGGEEIQYALSEIEIVRWRDATKALAGIDALQPRSMAMTGAGEPEVVRGAAVTSGLFPTLGVPPARGRLFTADEEARHIPLAVLGDRLWQRRFGASASAIGRSIALDGATYEIVGVMPAGFRPLLDASEVWIPLAPHVDPAQQSARMTAGVARLRPGATIAQAEAELAATSARLAREFPSGHGKAHPQVTSLRENLFGQQRPALVALGAGVLLLLLLACANVANLTLGHVSGRRAELTMRALLGASRWRLVQQQIVQSLVIATAGGVLGVIVVIWSLPALLALYARDGAAAATIAIDWRVLAFAAAAIAAAGVASGVLPAVRMQRASGQHVGALAVTRVGPGRRERRIRAALVVVQVAMAIALLCAAGTLLVSLERLLAAPRGYDADGVLTLQMLLPPAKYADVRARADVVEKMVARVSAIPGVRSAGTTQTTFMPNESMQTGLYVDGRPADPAAAETANIRHVTAGYFRTLRVPIVDGRPIDDRDRLGTAAVCMVSADFARQFWPRESALGHRIRRSSAAAQWMTIVGVAADVMDAGAGVKAGPTLYVPYLQNNTRTARVTLVVSTHADPLGSATAVRQAIWSIDPDQPVDRVARLADLLVTSAGDQRFRTVLLGLFAISGLLLALVGVYGVAAASVAAQRWEAGVRLALGARPGALVMKMLRDTTASVLAGAALGAVVFLGFGRLLSDLLYQTTAADVRVVAAAAALMIVGASAAAWLQARHIAHVSPTIALQTNP